MGAMALSQAMNALSIAALPFVLSPRWADAFALGLQVGTAALGGVVLGVVYNIALGRPGFDRWKTSGALAAVFSLLLGALVVVIAVTRGSSFVSLGTAAFIPLVAFSIGGAALAIGGTGGVRSAVHGRAVGLTTINIAPAAFFLASLFFVHALSWEPFVPALIWAAAAIVQIPIFWRRAPDWTVPEESGEQKGGVSTHGAALVVGVVASTVVPTLLITALSQLPAGSTSIAFLVTRIGTSVIGIGVNSILLVRYNWSSGSRNIEHMLRLIVLTASSVTIVALAFAVAQQALVTLVLVAAGWIISLVGSALVLREVNARRMGKTIAAKVAIDVSVSLIGCLVLFEHPSVLGYLALLVLSQAITATVTSVSLHFRLIASVAGLMVVASVALLVVSVLQEIR